MASVTQEPRPMVAALILDDQHRMLVVHSIKHGLRIEPPGGKVEPGEELEAAVKREILEELGVEISITSKLGVYRTESPEGPFDVHTFICAITSGEPRGDLEPNKIGGFQWVSADDLRKLAHPDDGSPSKLVPNLLERVEDLEKMLHRE